jgi:imidazolonepropionase-like amidohydrolase
MISFSLPALLSTTQSFSMRLLCFLFCLSATIAFAQPETTFPVNGPDDYRSRTIALTHATIYADYKTIITDGTLLIRDGRVVAAGKEVSIPAGCIIIDCTNRYIYPGFIDLYADLGMPEIKRSREWNGPQMESNEKGTFGWNQAIHSEFQSAQAYRQSDKADEYRKNGFTAVLTHRKDGIVRGTGSLVCLSSLKENLSVIGPDCSAHFSFSKGSSSQDYPSSLMGSIALLRQTYYDAQWYARSQEKREFNVSLDAFLKNLSKPAVFDAGDWQDVLRAHRIAREFNSTYLYKSDGTAYRRIQELKQAGVSLIIPLSFPKAYDVEDPHKALWVPLEDMKHWELAPACPAMLRKADIPFAITLSDIDNKDDFLKNLRLAVRFGLDSLDALHALTLQPAKMIGQDEKLGSLSPGKEANFFITGHSLFHPAAQINETWVQGLRYELRPFDPLDIRGTYAITVGSSGYTLRIDGEKNDPKAKIMLADSTEADGKFKLKNNEVVFSFSPDGAWDKRWLFTGFVQSGNTSWSGKVQLPDGTWAEWTAQQIQGRNADTTQAKRDSTDYLKNLGPVVYPFTAFGQPALPQAEDVLIRNGTVWTNEAEGNLPQTDVLIRNGKISKVGKNISCSDCRIIDATGKHVTSGIIDEHSHIAVSRGVNEGTEASSAEVRIGDVVQCEDVNMYRQLAGGVVAAQLLHGSANPIGGQSALIKFRWGKTPEELKIDRADGFIKFALGENVKQSNWGDRSVVRYPQTRMGVEQTYINYFTRAREYQRNRKLKEKETRVDLEMEALAEILNSKRFITCHSYVQSEINMLMHVADSFGFRVNTFTHILEGYKVADKMKAHGVHASTFADWWAYKYEVIDAIPYNTAILTRMGVCTAVNSDDAEMARRLNQEAAKGIRYGGLSEIEAWKTVTLNPAIMLHLNDQTGSVREGKCADIVVWSDNPLSIYARAEQTFVDGVCYYDREKDKIRREEVAKERARLMRKMLDEKRGGAALQQPVKKQRQAYDCGHGDHLE